MPKSFRAALCLIAALPLFGQDFAAKHQHAKGFCQGAVKITPDGISYSSVNTELKAGTKAKTPHNWTWKYQDIQQLEISPQSLRVLTYEDRETTFTGDFARAYLRLRDRMDRRLVACLADEQVQPLWTLSVKRLGRINGSQGQLIISGDRIVYKTEAKDASRTWRYSDIESLSSPDPHHLSVTTFEKSKPRLGSNRTFKFQLSEPLKEEQYQNLRRRLSPN